MRSRRSALPILAALIMLPACDKPAWENTAAESDLRHDRAQTYPEAADANVRISGNTGNPEQAPGMRAVDFVMPQVVPEYQ
jgi:hypothetical protein